MDLGASEQVVHHVAVHHQTIDFARRDAPGDLPGQPADLPLQLTHAGLAGVRRDHLGQGLIW